MLLSHRHDACTHLRPPLIHIRRNLERLPSRIPLATVLILLTGAGSAFAQCATPNIVLCNAQTADQESLLPPFNTLRGSAAGLALLNANLQTENTIY